MFNTRCVSIIPLMAARQSAKHISKVWKRRFQEKQLCIRGRESFSSRGNSTWILKNKLFFWGNLSWVGLCRSNVGAVFCNLTLTQAFTCFFRSNSNTKRILLVRAWTHVRPLVWIAQCRSCHVSHVSFKCRTEKEFLLTSGLRLLDPPVHLVAWTRFLRQRQHTSHL